MTKDWDSVQTEIKELSVHQKKSLEEVKAEMEKRHKFRASTRAYRMKLKEWGYMRHKPRKTNAKGSQAAEEVHQSNSPPNDERQSSVALEAMAFEPMEVTVPIEIAPNGIPGPEDFMNINAHLLAETPNLLSVDHWPENQEIKTGVVMDLLEIVLTGDSEKGEPLFAKNRGCINDPIGLPFDNPNSRFFNHPALTEADFIQHPDQKLLDIAAGLSSGPMVWVLLSYGARGTTTPMGTDIAIYNAIKNERFYTVQALLQPGRSNINGNPGTCWRPLLHAVTRNKSNIVRILLDRGATPNDITPLPENTVLPSALQICLARRARDYLDDPTRLESNKILKLLLDAGADVNVPVHGAETNGSLLTPWETFIEPWKNDANWSTKLSTVELECLKIFLSKGPDLHAHFRPFACGSATSNTFAHQLLWHSSPDIARILVDSASPRTPGAGSIILHEILGFCPEAKRHPTETLRDIQVLLQRGGADANAPDSKGITPLRKCIEQCPAIDITTRLQKLLDEGADPELPDQFGMEPFTLAASTFQEPLLSEIMHLLISNFRGQYPRTVGSKQYRWSPGYFPIPEDPDFRQATSYCIQNGDYMACLMYMVRGDIQTVFQRACSDVVTRKFLDAKGVRASAGANTGGGGGVTTMSSHCFTARESSEIQQVLLMRQVAGFAEYKFSSNFVMSLLNARFAGAAGGGGFNPTTTATESTTSTTSTSIDKPRDQRNNNTHFSKNTTTPDAPPPPTTTQPNPQSHHPPRSPTPTSPPSSPSSVLSFFIPSTTRVRWPQVYAAASSPGKGSDYNREVVRRACGVCADGNMLTDAEYERHVVEHAHARECGARREGKECRRRFCGGGGGG